MNEQTVKDSVSELIDQGQVAVDAIKSRVNEVKTQAKSEAFVLVHTTRTYVEAHPIKAIGIALGLGYVAMRIRTSPVMELAFLGAFGYMANRVLNKR
jgi:ElaB/YqjD/DUF883 family membrane-anchored ribosome-binding protein